MRINIGFFAATKKRRALCVFMAFLIILLTVVSGFIRVEGAITRGRKITQSTKSSGLIASGKEGSTSHSGYSVISGTGNNTDSSTLNYTYTGRIKSSNVKMYDYLSDREIDSNTPDSTTSDYTDPFTQFNTAVSNQLNDLTIPSEKNITIIFRTNSSTITTSSININMWLSNDSSKATAWPGVPMTYSATVAGVREYTYTFNPEVLGFTPDRFIFNNANDGTNPWRTSELSYTVSAGNTYSFTTDTISSTDNNIYFRCSTGGAENFNDWRRYVYLWDNNGNNNSYPGGDMNGNDSVLREKTYTFSSDWTPLYAILNDSESGSGHQSPNISRTFTRGHAYYYESTDFLYNHQDILFDYYPYGTWSSTAGSSSLSVTNSNYLIPLYFGFFLRGDNASVYTSSNKANYNNFFWRANLAMRDNDFTSAVQGLVDNTLTDGKLTQNGAELPYFNSSFNSTVMRSYESYPENGKTKEIYFPFYEVLASADNIKGYNGTTGSGNQARFYQFNSKDANLYFNGQTFEERSAQISGGGSTGFFPFNASDSSGQWNNCGFGAKFEMEFKLDSDGKVKVLDSTGKKISSKVDTMFEFVGDDDLWVFIDGNLVLDLGGCHKATSGLINFAEKKSYANKALSIGTTQAEKDDLSSGGSCVVTDISGLIADIDASGKYVETTTHKLTVFYMERGMGESNLMIRFNYAIEANTSRMKVQEITDFTPVNDGLKTLTQQVADNDVFKYSLYNNPNLIDGYSADSNFEAIAPSYPTYDKYLREDKGNGTTQLTYEAISR